MPTPPTRLRFSAVPEQPLPSVLAALLLALCSCGSVGKFVWVDELPVSSPSPEGGYVLGPGDVISVRVYGQEGHSSRGRIRTDGKITLPFLNDVQAAGYTPTALGQQLQTRLKEYLAVPVVTVSVDEARPVLISVLGQVGKQGVIQVEPGTRLAQVLAVAGGLGDLAHQDRIFVLRSASEPLRIRFTYEAITRAEGRAAQFVVLPGDVVVVE
jgi:polysaccharide export outer membrane protein